MPDAPGQPPEPTDQSNLGKSAAGERLQAPSVAGQGLLPLVTSAGKSFPTPVLQLKM